MRKVSTSRWEISRSRTHGLCSLVGRSNYVIFTVRSCEDVSDIFYSMFYPCCYTMPSLQMFFILCHTQDSTVTFGWTPHEANYVFFSNARMYVVCAAWVCIRNTFRYDVHIYNILHSLQQQGKAVRVVFKHHATKMYDHTGAHSEVRLRPW